VALEDRCPHRMAPLSMGRVEGDVIRCMYHGAQFGPDGRCRGVPGQDLVPASFVARRYAVLERDGWIWLWLGDAGQADPALVPVSELTQPAWNRKTGQLDYAAHYELLNDNLCDFSHLTFVHEATLAMMGKEAWSNTRPRISNLERGVRVERWIEGTVMPPFVPGALPKADLWMSYDYVLPGVLLMHGRFHPPGAASQAGLGPPPAALEPLHATYHAQAVTPTGPCTSRYFYGVGTRMAEPPQILEPVFMLTVAAFQEDKAMIEAQQRTIELSEGRTLRGTTHDQAVTRMRRLVEQALAADTA
jgi:vanillate O-demethylase monooxygenase subunit